MTTFALGNGNPASSSSVATNLRLREESPVRVLQRLFPRLKTLRPHERHVLPRSMRNNECFGSSTTVRSWPSTVTGTTWSGCNRPFSAL